MGNWRNRPRFYHQRRPPSSPPRSFDQEPPQPDGIPSWEKKFCALIGSVPWDRIVAAKNFMYCHSNVLNWDDSAGEEAFQNAKKRFWAKINNLPCDIYLPDPDIYVDEVDWNSYVDPELMKEIDHEYLAPPEEGERNVGKNKRTKNSMDVPSDGNIGNPCKSENPWECNNMQSSGTFEVKAQGWDQWDNHVDDSRNLNNADNLWEYRNSHGHGGLTDNAWGGRYKSSGWNQLSNNVNSSREWDSGNTPFEHGIQGDGSVEYNGWRKSGDSSRGWKLQEANNPGNRWGTGFIQSKGASGGRGWRNCGDAWVGGQPENYDNTPRNLEGRRNFGGWGARNESHRKKEGSHQYPSGFTNSRFQPDCHQTGRVWRRGENKKRVSFAPD
ncbi:Bifunctional endo-1 4-beta-xylanase XylA-like [Quillaja saponaria]|uniref:Bifunctional endo-1 4-beta-xylanase XylA-like n=1 Tax=Quillaja saponaria TaxID=32244 RepID=A0AAD7L0P4_QUISA|nr:Bifunctional endo-1 4-beta-xylanase XylA-like [Quillaja saponaria]